MVRQAIYFPGFERCDFEKLIAKVGSGYPDDIQEFNKWRAHLPYLENDDKTLWKTFYVDLDSFSGDYPDDEAVDHAMDIFMSRFGDLCRLVSFIFDPVEQQNVKLFFQEKMNVCPAEVPI